MERIWRDKTTWRKAIAEVTKEPLVACTLTEEELDVEFDDTWGGTEGLPFTAWTETLVLFPICYDGSEWVGSAPRNPCDKKLQHQGGG